MRGGDSIVIIYNYIVESVLLILSKRQQGVKATFYATARQ